MFLSGRLEVANAWHVLWSLVFGFLGESHCIPIAMEEEKEKVLKN